MAEAFPGSCLDGDCSPPDLRGGGGGGGAVEIGAVGNVSLSGLVLANGGTGGSAHYWAGGGGAGGGILVHAPTVSLSGTLNASGGNSGGGGGGRVLILTADGTLVSGSLTNNVNIVAGSGSSLRGVDGVKELGSGMFNQAPVAQCQNVTVAAGASCTANASINNGSYDPDSGDTITVTQAPAGPYALGTTPVTLTVTDAAGLFSSCTATVTVTNSAPVLSYANNPGNVYGVGMTINPLPGPSASVSSVTVQNITPALASGITVNSGGGVTIASTVPANTYSVTIRATDNCGANTDASFSLIIVKATPVLTWDNPADIIYGTALSATQLNATANVPGSFNYAPASGAVLEPGNTQSVTVTFTPTDVTNYNNASKSVTINVLKATPVITWSNPADIIYGTALSNTQLNATASVAGTFTYTPALNTVLNAGSGQNLKVDFTPTDPTHYNATSKTVTMNVSKATPALTWNNPADIIYGTALSAAQLNATANVAGSFVYTPAAGTVLNAGNAQTLTANFTPSDSTNFTTASKQVALNVLKAPLTVNVSNAFRNQGEANPPFSGSITGLKNGDNITASYSTTATTSSAPGTYPITATLSDPGNRLSNYQVTNNPGTLTILNSCGIVISPTTFLAASLALPYAQPLAAMPSGTYSFSLFAGSLPPGLQIVNNAGYYSLQGTPTTPGTYTFTVRTQRSSSTCEAIRTYTMTIAPTVVPKVTCKTLNPNGSYTVWFGYENSTGAVVTMPVGGSNFFTSGAQERGQPTVFQPGVVNNAFSVTFANAGAFTGWAVKGPDGLLRSVVPSVLLPGCP